MKKLISLVLCMIFLAATLTVPVSGLSVEGNEYFEDGSFISVGYGSPESWESLDGAEESGSRNIFTLLKRIIDFIKDFFGKFFSGEKLTVQEAEKTKYAAYYDSNGKLLWVVYLSAHFNFDGEKAECTEVNTFYEIKDSDWSVLSSDCEKTDNTATGTFVVKQHKLGVPLKEIERVLRLTCDEKGNIQ